MVPTRKAVSVIDGSGNHILGMHLLLMTNENRNIRGIDFLILTDG